MLSACPEHAISRSGHAPSTATSRTEHAPSIAPFPYPEEQDALTGGGDSPEDVLFRIPTKEGELEIRKVGIVLQDAEYAYIESGLAEGDLVVTTTLSTVTEGAPLRLEGAEAGSAENPEQENRDL